MNSRAIPRRRTFGSGSCPFTTDSRPGRRTGLHQRPYTERSTALFSVDVFNCANTLVPILASDSFLQNGIEELAEAVIEKLIFGDGKLSGNNRAF